MPSLIVLVLILPLVGAVGILALSFVSRLRPYTLYLALATTCVIAALVLSLRWAEPIEDALFSWQPTRLLGATPVLQSDLSTQPLALALALATCGLVLVELGRVGDPRPRFLAASLGLLVPGLVSLWASTPLAMIIGWASYDLLQSTARIAAGGSVRVAMRGLIFGSLSTMLLWGGTLLSGGGGDSSLWSLMSPTPVQLTLWMIAGLARLWVYPLHLSIPSDFDPPLSLLATLLLSPVIGWGLCLRLVLTNGGLLPGATWVPVLAAITLAVGSFQAWSCRNPRSALPWIGMASSGSVLLAAGLAGESAASVMAVGGVTWVLGMTALFLTNGLQREAPWWSIPALVGALALLGTPPFLGFTSQAALLGGITRQARLGLGSAVFLGDLFLVPSLVRWLLFPSSLPDQRRLSLAARGVGLALLAVPLVVAGFYPPLLFSSRALSLGRLFAMPGLVGWLLWAVSLAGGGVLAWQERNIYPRIEFLLSVAHDLLRLEWLYGAMAGALDRGLSVLRAADQVVAGAGALLWSWVLLLLTLLVWGSL